MFPALKERLLSHADLLVELSTLGEYGVDEHGALIELEREPRPARRVRDRCGPAGSRRPPAACVSDSPRAVRARP